MSVKTSILHNGLRIVTHEMPHLRTVSLGIWVDVGARSERPDEHGIAHLLEHMAFKGTKLRTAREIVEQIESVGGELNAATSLEMTAYYARVLKGDLFLALEILSDILKNPRFDENELAREKDVIFQEIAAAQDSPDEIVFDLAQEAAYPGQSLGRSILGTQESVASFDSAALRKYQNENYRANRMVLAAAGGLDHDKFVAKAEQYLSKIAGGGKYFSQPAKYQGGMRISKQSFEQSHIIVGFEGFSFEHEHFYAAQVFSSLFGGGMSSRLFQEIREKRGLCYSIYSFSWGLADTGLFGIHAATGKDMVPELLDVLAIELKKMSAQGPSEQELARAKAQLKAGLVMSLESSGARAEQLARQMIVHGRPLEVDELIQKVERVDCDQIRDLTQLLISRAGPICSGTGSLDLLETYDELVNRFN